MRVVEELLPGFAAAFAVAAAALSAVKAAVVASLIAVHTVETISFAAAKNSVAVAKIALAVLPKAIGVPVTAVAAVAAVAVPETALPVPITAVAVCRSAAGSVSVMRLGVVQNGFAVSVTHLETPVASPVSAVVAALQVIILGTAVLALVMVS